MMGPQLHALLGGAVLVVSLVMGIAALVSARRSVMPGTLLTVGVGLGFVLLMLQVLLGADLWFRVGSRPIEGVLAYVHLGGPVLALAGAAYHIFGAAKNRTRNYAVAMLITFALGLVSYAIGELGG